MTEAFIKNLGETALISIGRDQSPCLIAEGRADVYPHFGPTLKSDTAAAQFVVKEVEGRMTDSALKPLRYDRAESWTNPAFLAFGDTEIDWRNYTPCYILLLIATRDAEPAGDAVSSLSQTQPIRANPASCTASDLSAAIVILS